MSPSDAPPALYSRKGLRTNVVLSVVMMAIAVWLVFMFAPEDITCVREGQEVSCQLRRLVVDVPVWERRLDGFRIAETGRPDQRRSASFQRGNATSQHWILLWGKGAALESGSGEDASEVHARFPVSSAARGTLTEGQGHGPAPRRRLQPRLQQLPLLFRP